MRYSLFDPLFDRRVFGEPSANFTLVLTNLHEMCYGM